VLLLESAFFAPASVRRTSRRLALPSQAAYRFERRVDPAMVPEALDAVAALIARTAGGRVAPGIVEDAPGTKALAPPTIRLRPPPVRTRRNGGSQPACGGRSSPRGSPRW